MATGGGRRSFFGRLAGDLIADGGFASEIAAAEADVPPSKQSIAR